MTTLRASFAAPLRRIPLIDFKAKGPEPSKGHGRGVSYMLPEGRSRLPQAFIATMQSGHRWVFERATVLTKKSKGAWKKNLPMIQLYGPSLGHVLDKMSADATAVTEASFEAEFNRQLQRLLGKVGAPDV